MYRRGVTPTRMQLLTQIIRGLSLTIFFKRGFIPTFLELIITFA